VCLERPGPAENKAIFDDLKAHQREIEDAFGGPFSWRRLDDKRSSRISAPVEGGSVLEEATWPTLQTAMVKAMVRMEEAMGPFIEKYRQGAVPGPTPLA